MMKVRLKKKEEKEKKKVEEDEHENLEMIIVAHSDSSEHEKSDSIDVDIFDEGNNEVNEDGEDLHFSDMPREVYVNVFKFLDVRDILSMSVVSKRYLRVGQQEEVWDDRYKKWTNYRAGVEPERKK